MFNLIKELARKRHIVRCDYICPACNTLDIAVVGISDAAEKVDYSYRCVIRAGLKIENNDSFFIEHVGNRAYVLISVKLFENNVSL